MIFPLGAITNGGRLSSISLPDLYHSKVYKKNLKKKKQNSAPSLACWQLQIHIFFHILYINAPRSAVDNTTCSAVSICLFVVCFPFKIHTSPGPHRQIQRFKTPFSPCTGLSCNTLLTALSPTSPLFPSVQFNTFNSVSINWASSPCKALRVEQNKGSASVLGCDFTTGEKCSLPFPLESHVPGDKGITSGYCQILYSLSSGKSPHRMCIQFLPGFCARACVYTQLAAITLSKATKGQPFLLYFGYFPSFKTTVASHFSR